jgi:predicted ABC-type ATPase
MAEPQTEEKDRPHVVVIAGPNGAGKTTAAPALFRDALAIGEFVNADAIAGGLSGFAAATVAMQAGRAMLRRLRELAGKRVDFAFEVTLASRTLASWLSDLKKEGYFVEIVFLYLPDAENAVARVRERVRRGGHVVDEETVRRRFDRSLQNFLLCYRLLADRWRLYCNLDPLGPRLIAAGEGAKTNRIDDRTLWERIALADEKRK